MPGGPASYTWQLGPGPSVCEAPRGFLAGRVRGICAGEAHGEVEGVIDGVVYETLGGLLSRELGLSTNTEKGRAGR